MLLDSLLKLVETLRERIDEHGGALRQSEALTRYALIDPMLRELGWDTDDPALVVPEYRSGSGSADYALLNKGKPLMMLEAKKLGTQLQDAVVQGVQYCLMEGTPYFALTDGNRWEVYRIQGGVPIADQRVGEFNFKDQSPAEACLKALALWRPSVGAGHVSVGSAPVVGLGNSQPPTATRQRHHHSTNDQEWKVLSEFDPESGTKPMELMFPNKDHVPLKSWKSMLLEVIRWLSDEGHLTTGDCPISYSDRSKRYLVALQPNHQDGLPFAEGGEERVGPFFIDTKHSARHIAKSAISIIERVGQDTSQFKVRLPMPRSSTEE